MNNKNQQKGFTILVAVVTASILLIVAMSIGGLALKEQVLSIANKESQIAFYAADTGMECALYWDEKEPSLQFAPDTNPTTADIIPQTKIANIICNGVSITPTLSLIANGYSYKFMVTGISVGSGGTPTCAVVEVKKDTSNQNQVKTDILSYGYNTCAASLTRFERGIDAHYGY